MSHWELLLENVATGTIDNTLSNLVLEVVDILTLDMKFPTLGQLLQLAAISSSTINTGELFSDQLDTRLYILDGACEGTELACDDDFPGANYGSQSEFDVTSGTEYYVVVDGYSSFSAGDFGLSMLPALPQFLKTVPVVLMMMGMVR